MKFGGVGLFLFAWRGEPCGLSLVLTAPPPPLPEGHWSDASLAVDLPPPPYSNIDSLMEPEISEDCPGLEKLRTVQDVLDANRLLISQVNRNQELRTPEAMAKNVVLIRELNSNLFRVVEMYKGIAEVMVNARPAEPMEEVEEISTEL